MKRLIIWLVLLAALGAGGYFGWQWYQDQSKAAPATYRFGEVKRTDIISSISATGTLVPEDVVDIGAQVNGPVASFGVGTDGKPVDYRSMVTEGSVLARLDETVYAADVASGEAALSLAQAAVRVAEAGRAQAQAKLEQSQRDWARAQKLGESKALSQADYDASKSSFEQAQASISLADAQIGQAQAQVASAQASLQRSRRNLLYCTIKSPVTGVIIDRKVDIGQTVVSSLNAPSLFLIAKDLSRMQVLVQVNEADIGQVAPGMKVTFTVEAFPADSFEGEVLRVRLNATMTQNVVTYTVEIATNNADLKLLPYLTANVRFIIDKREQAVAVPNAALRWAPASEGQAAQGGRGQRAGGQSENPQASDKGPAPAGADPKLPSEKVPSDRAASDRARPAADAAKPEGAPKETGRAGRRGGGRRSSGTVYVLRDGKPVGIKVRTGLTDGTNTEITTDELADGDQIIVGEVSTQTSAAAPSGGTNPFAPAPMFPRGGGGGGRPGGR
jgi:HlyD family secretion protein